MLLTFLDNSKQFYMMEVEKYEKTWFLKETLIGICYLPPLDEFLKTVGFEVRMSSGITRMVNCYRSFSNTAFQRKVKSYLEQL